MGDFNSEFSENPFCNVNSLKTLNRGPTCFKNPSNPSCIDLFLTNRQQGFQQTHAIETGISDFHKMVVTVMKTHYKKQKAKTIQYRNCKHFHEQSFNFELNNELIKIDINNSELKEFNEFFLKVLDKHAPRKEKYIRANNSSLITLTQKLFGKKLCTDLGFATHFAKQRKTAYNRQRNICVSLLRKTKRVYYYFANLDTKIMKDNRKFWKTVNPLSSEKSYSKESISLINKDGLITKKEDLAKTFNVFFSSIVKKTKHRACTG